MIIDSHCHLEFEQYKNDLELVLLRAKEAGVELMQTISTRVSKFDQIRPIIDKYKHIYASIGNHPNEIHNEGVISIDELEKLTYHPKIIGIGETGLDYHYSPQDKDKQIESFITHISVSRNTKLPVIVHTRDADEDTIYILRQEMKKGKFTGLIHCFSTSRELAEQAIEIGLYISISGIITFKNATNLQSIVRDLPLERLLVETDAPYLAPAPYRGKRNEPAYVKEVVAHIANLKNMDINHVANITSKNFFDLFSKVNNNLSK